MSVIGILFFFFTGSDSFLTFSGILGPAISASESTLHSSTSSSIVVSVSNKGCKSGTKSFRLLLEIVTLLAEDVEPLLAPHPLFLLASWLGLDPPNLLRLVT